MTRNLVQLNSCQASSIGATMLDNNRSCAWPALQVPYVFQKGQVGRRGKSANAQCWVFLCQRQ
jgi:hypothetical protein